MIFNQIIGGKKLPSLDNPGDANDILSGKQLIDQFGNPITGTIPIKTSSNITINGRTITVPSGYYTSQVSKSVSTATQATPSISVSSSGLITASSTQSEGYVSSGTKTSTQQLPLKTSSDVTVNGSSITVPSGYYTSQVSKSVSTAAQATPSISVSSSGLITASSTQSEGYVSAGTKSSTKQLSTQAGTTITPSVIQKTAITAGKYTTGPIYVAGSSNLIASNIKSGVNIFGVIGNLSSQKIWSGWNLSGSFGYGTFTITFPEITSINKVYAAVISVYLYVDNQPIISDSLLVISPHMVEGAYAGFKGMYAGKYNITIRGNSLVFNSTTYANNYTNSFVQTGNAAVNYLIYE